jgi:hypothetical protein
MCAHISRGGLESLNNLPISHICEVAEPGFRFPPCSANWRSLLPVGGPPSKTAPERANARQGKSRCQMGVLRGCPTGKSLRREQRWSPSRGCETELYKTPWSSWQPRDLLHWRRLEPRAQCPVRWPVVGPVVGGAWVGGASRACAVAPCPLPGCGPGSRQLSAGPLSTLLGAAVCLGGLRRDVGLWGTWLKHAVGREVDRFLKLLQNPHLVWRNPWWISGLRGASATLCVVKLSSVTSMDRYESLSETWFIATLSLFELWVKEYNHFQRKFIL